MKTLIKFALILWSIVIVCLASQGCSSKKSEQDKALSDWVSARALQRGGSIFVLTKSPGMVGSYTFYALHEYKVGPWRTENVRVTDLDKVRGYNEIFVAAIPAVSVRGRTMYSDKGWEPWSQWNDIQGEEYVRNGFSGNGVIKFAKTDKGWIVFDNGGWGDFVWPPPNGWE